MTGWRLLIGCAAALPAAASAASEWVPHPPDGAERTVAVADGRGLHGVAIGPAGAMSQPPTLPMEGARHRIAWRAPPGGATAAALVDALRAQLDAAGFEMVYACSDAACGGFDFRRALDVLPMPEMIVDLGGFEYLSARRGLPDAPEALASLIASDTAAGAHVQLTLIAPAPAAQTTVRAGTKGSTVPDIGPDTGTAPPPGAVPRTGPPPAPQDIAGLLATTGRLPLDGVTFATGTARIDTAPPPVLLGLADWLRADPARRVALVGHTDWTGPPDVNRALSRRRAQAVAGLLIGTLGVAADQIVVEGAGPFAPLSPNATEAGRAANRRVEAVTLPPAAQ